MSKLILILRGGLGNQLFMYAAARRLAFYNSAEIVIDDVSGFNLDLQYRRSYQLDKFNISFRKATAVERLEPFPRLRRKLISHWNQYLPFGLRSYIIQEKLDFDPRLLTLKFKDTLYLEGYWQSENYFKDIEKEIRKEFSVVAPLDSRNLEISKAMNAHNSIFMHIRFFNQQGDLSVPGGPVNASANYYKKAVDYMESRVNDAHYYIFSDQPQLVKEIVSLPKDKCTLVDINIGDSNSYADLWLMSKCRHAIIANSTFSWWGAWLNTYSEKIIITPYLNNNFVNGWGFKGLIPNSWVIM